MVRVLIYAILIGLVATLLDFAFHILLVAPAPLLYWATKFGVGFIVALIVLIVFESRGILFKSVVIGVVAGLGFAAYLSLFFAELGGGYEPVFHAAHIVVYFIAAFVVLLLDEFIG